MLEVYLTENEDVYKKLEYYLSRHIPYPFEILKTENEKPYIEGDPLFFSLSHKDDKAVIAISDKPVGADLEVFKDNLHPSLLSRFSLREQGEICGEWDFLRNWTAKEAFIKMKGETLAKFLKRLEYFGGNIYLDGVKQNCKIEFKEYPFGVACIVLE